MQSETIISICHHFPLFSAHLNEIPIFFGFEPKSLLNKFLKFLHCIWYYECIFPCVVCISFMNVFLAHKSVMDFIEWQFSKQMVLLCSDTGMRCAVSSCFDRLVTWIILQCTLCIVQYRTVFNVNCTLYSWHRVKTPLSDNIWRCYLVALSLWSSVHRLKYSLRIDITSIFAENSFVWFEETDSHSVHITGVVTKCYIFYNSSFLLPKNIFFEFKIVFYVLYILNLNLKHSLNFFFTWKFRYKQNKKRQRKYCKSIAIIAR